MKLAIKLRTRLFLSISALITVALLGLLLGVVSVMQMAKSQGRADPRLGQTGRQPRSRQQHPGRVLARSKA